VDAQAFLFVCLGVAALIVAIAAAAGGFAKATAEAHYVREHGKGTDWGPLAIKLLGFAWDKFSGRAPAAPPAAPVQSGEPSQEDPAAAPANGHGDGKARRFTYG